MKTRMMILAVLLSFLTLIMLGSCGPGKYVPKANEEIYGTWTNEKYGIMNAKIYSPQKEIIDASGYTAYQSTSDHNPSAKGPETIVSKWTDSEGNIWYKTLATGSNGEQVFTRQALEKLSKFATVRECMYSWLPKLNPDSYPKDIDPVEPEYKIYYRTK
ncbi:MAG: hypothetical protein ABSG17_21215 [Spirochaetia bacterium]